MDNLELAHLYRNTLSNDPNEIQLLMNGGGGNYIEEASMDAQDFIKNT